MRQHVDFRRLPRQRHMQATSRLHSPQIPAVWASGTAREIACHGRALLGLAWGGLVSGSPASLIFFCLHLIVTLILDAAPPPQRHLQQ